MSPKTTARLLSVADKALWFGGLFALSFPVWGGVAFPSTAPFLPLCIGLGAALLFFSLMALVYRRITVSPKDPVDGA